MSSVGDLRDAWKHVKSAAKPSNFSATDSQHLTPRALFERDLEIELKRLSRELRAGEFCFSPLVAHFMTNRDATKERMICVPSIADRVVQRSLLTYLTRRRAPKWLLNPISFGFVPDRGVRLAAQTAVHHRKLAPWVFKTDISKFFDKINRDDLRVAIRKKVPHRSLHRLLDAALSCEVEAKSKGQAAKIASLGIKRGLGVRQGMPLSPVFANLLLADFDVNCQKKSLRAVRYADDLVFFASSEEAAKEIASFCESELEKLSLSIPALISGGKTAIYAPSEPAEFLGVEMAMNGAGNYELRVSDKQLNAIKDDIYTLQDIDELNRRKINFAQFGNVLQAKVEGFAASYHFCANCETLNARLIDWRTATISKVLHRLGVDVPSLSEQKKKFVGLL